MVNQWTYVIRDNDNGLVKIGRSINPENRLKSLISETGNDLVLWCTWEDHSLEKELHDKFAAYRVSGEWFSPHDDLWQFINQNSWRSKPARQLRDTLEIKYYLVMVVYMSIMAGFTLNEIVTRLNNVDAWIFFAMFFINALIFASMISFECR